MFSKFIHENKINTEADSMLRGLELQKIRVVDRLLEGLINKKTIMCTLEYVDDVFQVDIGDSIPVYTVEQDKSYSSNFTLNSHEIKNTLRIFLDTWLGMLESSEKIKFVFYTNASFAKEKKCGELNNFNELPKIPILKLLEEGKVKEALPYVKAVVSKYYINQYKNQKQNIDVEVYEKIINQLTDEQWIEFLGLIEWRFGNPDESELKSNVMNKINLLCMEQGINTRFSTTIYAEILNLVNSKSFEKDFLNRVVHVSEIKVIFLEKVILARIPGDLNTSQGSNLDPLYVKWDDIEVTEFRDIKEKIYSVCKDYDEDEMDYIMTDCVDGLYEQQQYYDEKAVKAYNYRIYNVCKKIVNRLIKKSNGVYSESEINEIIKNLEIEAQKVIKDKGKTYNLPFKDDEMIRKTILILFNECYLAFD